MTAPHPSIFPDQRLSRMHYFNLGLGIGLLVGMAIGAGIFVLVQWLV